MNSIEVDRLIARVAHKDRVAFDQLYRLLERPIHGFVNRRLNDPDRSADVVHEVFLEVWRGAARFQGRSSARTWIFSIAFRRAMDVHRRNRRLRITGELPEQIDDTPGAEETIAARQQAEAVRACLAGLKDEHRVAIELTFYEEMSYQQIALVVGVPEGTVKSRVYHAKQLLLHCLSVRLGAGVRR